MKGVDYYFFHAWRANAAGAINTTIGRIDLLDRIYWESGWPRINDGTPSTTQQILVDP